MKIRIFTPLIILFSAAALASCGESQAPQVIDPPRLAITCPDPSARNVLTAESTYRDLARSRAEAIHGWTTCSDALRISVQ